MKKIFVTTAMVMSMGCAFAQGNVAANDTVKTDTTKACPAKEASKALAAFIANDSTATDSAKTAAAALMAMNDTVVTDSAQKAQPEALVAMNDTVVTDTAKAQPAKAEALVAMNDTVVTDTTKAQPAKAEALVAMVEAKASTVQAKDSTATTPACDKKAGEKAIRALNAMRKITA